MIVVAALALSACGDSDEPAAPETAATTETAPAVPKDKAKPQQAKKIPPAPKAPPVSVDSGIEGPAPIGDRYDPSASDGKTHGDGSIEGFGEAADDGEAQEAVAVAVGYYDARAAGDWDRACDLLSSGIKEQLEQTYAQGEQAKSIGCPEVLASLAGGIPRQLRVQQAKTIRFTDFRVEDDGGYAMFVSDVIPNGFVPMHREDDEWRVAAIAGSSL